MPDPVTIAIVGAGGRGRDYARLAAETGQARVVAVAEPSPFRRERVAREHGIPADHVFEDWRQLAERPRLADAVVIATQDRFHAEPAVAMAGLGYNILLEKPIAPTEAEAVRIVEAAEQAGVQLAICHVMRYTPYTRRIRGLIEAGRIGDVVSVQHLEPVGWWHFAHSFVRGNWRNETLASPMLLAKSCHDVDWVQHIVDRPAVRVSSFGNLYHFRPEQAPPGAGERCVDCAVEASCPYSAARLYRSCLGDPVRERWPLGAVTDVATPEAVELALREGPYGRCVYSCDNDVVDHQVVTIEYEGGVTASLTIAAFTPMSDRRTRILGTRGYIEGDGRVLNLHDFVTSAVETIDSHAEADASAAGGHAGGDAGLIRAFVASLSQADPALIKTGPMESLDSHRVVWAAEKARREGVVVTLDRSAA